MALQSLTKWSLREILKQKEHGSSFGLCSSRLTLFGDIVMKKLFVNEVKTERASPEVVAACRKAGCCGK